MTCREVIEYLMRFQAGELSPTEQAAFDRHMQLCPPCVQYLRSYNQAVALSRQSCCPSFADALPQVPEQLVQAILSARKEARGQADGS